MSDMSADEEMYVIKRNGTPEIVSFDKILTRIKKIGLEANIKINYTTLGMKVIDQLYSGISTTKLMNYPLNNVHPCLVFIRIIILLLVVLRFLIIIKILMNLFP